MDENPDKDDKLDLPFYDIKDKKLEKQSFIATAATEKEWDKFKKE